MRLQHWIFAGLAMCNFAKIVVADTIVFGGQITQPQDVTEPAANNVSLNKILELQDYLATLVFPGSITGPGTFDLTGSSLTLGVPAAPASETSFDGISLTVAANGSFLDFSLLGCLTTGNGCLLGNQLDANFEIAAAGLNATGVAATGMDQPHPLDLLEDDGVTDIHGDISTYSYTSSSPVPEPSSLFLLCCALALVVGRKRLRGSARS